MADKDAEVIPLYIIVEGDTVVTLLLARWKLTMAELCERALRSASVRLNPAQRYFVVVDGKPLSPETTVRDAGIAPLDRVDVRKWA
ncbi:MAG: hypothetical protein HY791_11690 [Deltaproteobacteria bacterium]|nr:hypothetical protein [Deltaproteobacteria bacterium]